jgi:hypothetical protein
MASLGIRTVDGFTLILNDETGGPRAGTRGGFSLRDVAAGTEFAPQAPAREQEDGAVVWEAEENPLGLLFSARYQVVGRSIRVDGEVHDLLETDRAITVRFSYPVDAIGGQWHDDMRRARPIVAGEQYGNFADRGVGATGFASRYPFACVTGWQLGVVVGAPLDLPRLWRFGYDAAALELYAEVDLGLSTWTSQFPSRATFSLVLYRCDPEWGFRSALERYYQLFPLCFTKRNGREGIWMPFTDIATVEGFEDFGFQFKEGDNNVPFDAAHGIYSFVYVEPWSNWVRMPKEMPRTIAQATEVIRERAAQGEERDRATLTSAVEDSQGEWIGRIENEPWCDGAVFCVNPNPRLPAAPEQVTQFRHLLTAIERAFARSPELSGVYHDSFEMYLFPRALNYRREHFAETETPLVFDAQGRVCQSLMFDMVDFAREVAMGMWARGKMTFANGTPFDTPWGAAWLDVMGTEFSHGFSDQLASYWRSLCAQRPYLLLYNTDYRKLPAEAVESYMKRATFYGFFPSFFSHNASEDPYWRNPALYNRDRPLFKKYLPIICALSEAGWEPVTHAHSNNPQVLVERFGRPGQALYLTVLNDSDQPQHATIVLDIARLRVRADRTEIEEVLSGAPLSLSPRDGAAAATLDLPAGDVRVLHLA